MEEEEEEEEEEGSTFVRKMIVAPGSICAMTKRSDMVKVVALRCE